MQEFWEQVVTDVNALMPPGSLRNSQSASEFNRLVADIQEALRNLKNSE